MNKYGPQNLLDWQILMMSEIGMDAYLKLLSPHERAQFAEDAGDRLPPQWRDRLRAKLEEFPTMPPKMLEIDSFLVNDYDSV